MAWARAGFIGLGIAAISVVAAGLTEATLVHGRWSTLSDGSAPQVTPTPSPTATPLTSPTPTRNPTPTATPVLASNARTATTNAFVHVRAQPSINSAIINNVDGGTVVNLGNYVDTQWQSVIIAGQTGYIYRPYLNY